jgi:ATP-dependent DNA helicase PIF1
MLARSDAPVLAYATAKPQANVVWGSEMALTGPWKWLFGERSREPFQRSPAAASPSGEAASAPPLDATRPTLARSSPAESVRTLGHFNRDLPPTSGRDGARPAFARDLAYETSPGVGEALRAIDSGDAAVMVVGRAGTGKTRLVRYLRGRPGSDKQAVVAPTGIAALNAQAQTIHSFFQFPIGVLDCREIPPLRGNGQLLRRMERLIIDEISMVRADVLDAIDARLRHSRADDRPFGGVQVVLVGDFLQLPPVTKLEEWSILQALKYRSPYAFSAHVLDNVPVKVVELEKVHRQSEVEFIDILARIRSGGDMGIAVRTLNERCMGSHRADAKPILLTPTRAAAERYNREGLEMIPTPSVFFDARIEGDLHVQHDQLPVPERLELKVGARVMAAKNDPAHRWVNGSLGTVSSLGRDDVGIKFDHDVNECRVGRAVWEKQRQEWDVGNQRIRSVRVAAYSQLPLVPAWAITIHKAQGLSLDDVRIDLGHGAFASGQVYVALSRAKTLRGLSLTREIRIAEVKTDPMLLDFIGWLRDRASDN